MNGLSPQYLADNCQLTSTAGRRRLRPTSLRVRFHELALVWAIAHSLLLDRVSPSTWLWIDVLSWSSASYCKTYLLCWGQRRLVTVCFCAPYKSAFTLHYIYQQFMSVFFFSCRTSTHQVVSQWYSRMVGRSCGTALVVISRWRHLLTLTNCLHDLSLCKGCQIFTYRLNDR